MGRLSYERMSTFLYECGIIGHGETECTKKNDEHEGNENVKQYGDWLSASLLVKKSYIIYMVLQVHNQKHM